MSIFKLFFSILIFLQFSAVKAELAISSRGAINIKGTECAPVRNSNDDVVKLAHMMGRESRSGDFLYGSNSGYYNSAIQAKLAQDNLAHIQCKQNGVWNKNTTSGFFIDVEDFARSNGVTGNFSSCKSKVLVTVAHYVNSWGGEASAKCKVRKDFDPRKLASGPGLENLASDMGIARKISVGGVNSSAYTDDFAFIKIDNLRYSKQKQFETLKICSQSVSQRSYSGSSCNDAFEDNIILPHLALNRIDKNASSRGRNYRAKESSGKCCVSEKDKQFGLLKHTCDMDKRSSGSPLLSISGTGQPCVLGVQKGQSKPGSPKENYAVSTADDNFRNKLISFIQSNCG